MEREEAIEIARKLYNESLFLKKDKEAMVTLIPELKESEDEKIRKSLINYVYCHGDAGDFTKKEFVAWLEKQSQTFTKKDVDDAYLKGVTNTKNEIEKQYEANYQIRKDIATFIFNYRGDIKDRAKWMDYLGIKVSFVEKQGEQKTADKIEPKFKVGDYVVDNCGYIWRIEGVINQFYVLEGIDGGESRPTIEWVNNTFHHWTILNAKDGDVLAAHECLVLFREIDGLNIRCYCTYHFMNNPSFHVDTLQNKDAFHPATREQHDQLEKAMADAGYTFDFDKKDFKNIEPKFKVGDWVVNKFGDSWHIDSFDKKNYQVSDGKGNYNYFPISKQNEMHLWTIHDAKDGDVICYKDEISLYKHDIKNCTKQGANFGGFVYYCCYDGKRFIMNNLYSLVEQDKMDIHPASKEQCDRLLSKMREAGYELDADKKKPKFKVGDWV